MNFFLLLSIPFLSEAIQVFVFPSGGPSSNISSVLYVGNDSSPINHLGSDDRSNSSGLRKLLPQEFTICSTHQQELLDEGPPYQVSSTLKILDVFLREKFILPGGILERKSPDEEK